LGNMLGISSFLISLMVLSIGTNLPEISLAIRSVVSQKKEIAFGDYLGSAAANTLVFGMLTFLHGKPISIPNRPFIPFFFMSFGFGIFYMLLRKKNEISRKAGMLLLIVYVFFLLIQTLER
jgi:cation:H+ antiporter